MRILAITNQKGGSGKTTTAVNLAAALGEKGRRVLLVDLDPQASATAWLGVKDAGRGIYDVFTNNKTIESITLNTSNSGVDVAPASAWLVGVEKALAGEVGTETLLKRAIGKLKNYDYVILDCPPSLGLLTINALTAARELLIPVEAHVLALAGLAQLLETMEKVKERLNPTLAIAGILACRVDHRTRHAQDIEEQLRKRFGRQVYAATIRENIRLAEAPSFGQAILQYDSSSSGAADYRALATLVIKQEKTAKTAS
jgi:chromosome partitioning protein